ncbi:MAG TPA: hypothetical protein VLB44_01215 [Kofleriaceae bacterium]|nr:hypothetical protein [Kofleriaceae bacterium]
MLDEEIAFEVALSRSGMDPELMHTNLVNRRDVAGGPAASRRFLRRWRRIHRHQRDRSAAALGYLELGGEAG